MRTSSFLRCGVRFLFLGVRGPLPFVTSLGRHCFFACWNRQRAEHAALGRLVVPSRKPPIGVVAGAVFGLGIRRGRGPLPSWLNPSSRAWRRETGRLCPHGSAVLGSERSLARTEHRPRRFGAPGYVPVPRARENIQSAKRCQRSSSPSARGSHCESLVASAEAAWLPGQSGLPRQSGDSMSATAARRLLVFPGTDHWRMRDGIKILTVEAFSSGAS